jgi:glycyl-tRNA synthetase alpha chain
MLDGLEVTQFTYFQQCGGIDLFPICAELTYGLERIAAFLQDVDSIYDIVWARDPVRTYGEVRLDDEKQFSVYNFEAADIEKTWKHFELYEAECKEIIEKISITLSSLADGGGNLISIEVALAQGLEAEMAQALCGPILAAYDFCLKCSHLFNILDARGAISVTERVAVIARVRALAVGIAKTYVRQQQLIERLPSTGALSNSESASKHSVMVETVES